MLHNIKNTQMQQGNSEGGEGLVDALGNQLKLTDADLALLQESGENAEFAELLQANTSLTEDQKSALAKELIQNQQELHSKILDKNQLQTKETKVDPKLLNSLKQIDSQSEEIKSLFQKQPKISNKDAELLKEISNNALAENNKSIASSISEMQPQLTNTQKVVAQNITNADVSSILGNLDHNDLVKIEKVMSAKGNESQKEALVAKSEDKLAAVETLKAKEFLLKDQAIQSAKMSASGKQVTMANTAPKAQVQQMSIAQNNQAAAQLAKSNTLNSAAKANYMKGKSNPFMKKQTSITNTTTPVGTTHSNVVDLMAAQQAVGTETAAAATAVTAPSMVEGMHSNQVSTAPVYDMSALNTSRDAGQIIEEINNYIIQTKEANREQVDLKVSHNDLGLIDIKVEKGIGQELNVKIGTHSVEGSNFFKAHQNELVVSLNTNGIRLGDFKIEQQAASKDFSQQGQSGQQHKQDQQFGSESGQRRHDQDRRQKLWDQFSEKDVA